MKLLMLLLLLLHEWQEKKSRCRIKQREQNKEHWGTRAENEVWIAWDYHQDFGL